MALTKLSGIPVFLAALSAFFKARLEYEPDPMTSTSKRKQSSLSHLFCSICSIFSWERCFFGSNIKPTYAPSIVPSAMLWAISEAGSTLPPSCCNLKIRTAPLPQTAMRVFLSGLTTDPAAFPETSVSSTTES